MNGINGKVAIITGGTGGLGKDVLQKFVDEGAHVTCTYIVDKELGEAKDKFSDRSNIPNFIKADVTNTNDVRKVISDTVEKFGKVDFLINIVGGFLYKDYTDTTDEEFDKMVNMNLKSCFVFSREILPSFMENNFGRIVNISAKPAIKGVAGMTAYGSSKAAVATLTESIADEIKEYDINVNAVIPGTIDTEQNRKDMPDKDFSKLVKPADIANVIAFLCSDESSIVRGAVIPALGQTY